MSHDTHVLDHVNQDKTPGLSTAEEYLRLLKHWKDPFPEPIVELVQEKYIIREDLLEVGSKARLADALITLTKGDYDEYVYCQPKCGYAGISLSYACRDHGKDCTLFVPESKEFSEHQRRCAAYGATLIPHKIYGMSGLRKAARDYAEGQRKQGRRIKVIEMGMKHEPICTAAFINTARRTGLQPKEVWTVLSTGQMSRALQIAWPEAEFFGVAVARNMHEGECGELMSKVYSHPLPFLKDEAKEYLPPFPSATNYDAKAWRYFKGAASPGALFWNVAGP